uniref:hypothetical protein n=1 Tax=Eubacterium cellulosolvens TaxID=29322 RepID=UPI0004801439|nr:hypothetical protein [[Eubacterium] cellulosolvens]
MSKYSTNLKTVFALFLIVCSIVIIFFLPSNNPFDIGNTYTDSSVYTYIGHVMKDGGMPYLDAFDHKGPVLYLIELLGLTIHRNIGIWFLEILSLAIGLFYTYRCARLYGCGRVSSCVTVFVTTLSLASFFFDGGNIEEEYAFPLLMISLFCFLKYFLTDRISRVELTACGAAFAAVCLIRVNMAGLWFILCLGVIVDCVKQRKANKLPKLILYFLLGTVVVSLPVLVWLIRNHAFFAFVEDYLKFNFAYSTGHGSIRIFQSMNGFLKDTPVLIGIPVTTWFCLRERKLTDILCLICYPVSLLLLCLSGHYFFHYGLLLCPLFAWTTARALSFVEQNRTVQKRKWTYALTLSLAVCMLFNSTFLSIAGYIADPIRDVEKQPMVKTIVNEVTANTEDDDAISVMGNCNIIYLLSGRSSVSKYSYQDPIAAVSPEILNEYLMDLQSLKAKMLIVDSTCSFYDSVKNEIKKVTDKNYRLLDRVEQMEVYVRK